MSRGHLGDRAGDFLGVLGEVAQAFLVLKGLDALEQVLRSVDGHGITVLPGLFQFGDRAGDGAGQGVEPVPLGEQPPVVAAQGVHLVDLLGQDPARRGAGRPGGRRDQSPSRTATRRSTSIADHNDRRELRAAHQCRA